MTRLFLLSALLCISSSVALAVDVEIRFGALERMIGEQAFTAEGRRYVQGDKDQKCRYAFLDHPKLSAAGDRLQLKVNFTGKTALGMFGKCVGLGDAFELTLRAMPAAKNGVLEFESFEVSTPRDSYYIRRVRTALVETLNKNFRLDILAQARKMVEAPQQMGNYSQEIKDLRLGGVRVSEDSLVLSVDFKIIVK